jgi:hypothetical protein
MNRNARRAIEEWDNAVSDEAARLIGQGWAPLEAFELAKKRVAERRQRKAATSSGDSGR